jgi:hypothetical protein
VVPGWAEARMVELLVIRGAIRGAGA